MTYPYKVGVGGVAADGAAPVPAAPAPAPRSPGNTSPLPGQLATDYSGSYDEWYERTVAAMIRNFMLGVPQTDGSAPSSGIYANQADFGAAKDNPEAAVSWETVMFFEQYVSEFGATDTWMIGRFGMPPDRRATYVEDPNSNAAIQKGINDTSIAIADRNNATDLAIANARNATDLAIAQGNNRTAIDVANIDANARIQGIKMQVASDWKIAALNDATRRYVAEGDWGTQRYVAELQDKGMTERLKMQLAFNEKALAQDAIAESNRHSEQLAYLALEVAKFDAELGSQPRNWLKYAGWLASRNILVNGISLAMAADMVPDSAISPYTIAEQTGSGVATLQTAADVQQAGLSGQQTDQFNQGVQEGLGGHVTQPAGNVVNPEDPTATLLGQRPVPGAADLQAAYDSVAATGRQTGQGSYGGGPLTATTPQGVNVNVRGDKVRYDEFTDLLPSQQQMNVGAAEAGGKWAPDYIEEMERSRPKGAAVGAAAYG